MGKKKKERKKSIERKGSKPFSIPETLLRFWKHLKQRGFRRAILMAAFHDSKVIFREKGVQSLSKTFFVNILAIG